MNNFLQVNNSTLPNSPTGSSFMADEVASICPLITPSPPTNDLINPLPETTETNFTIGQELATILQQQIGNNDDDKRDDSASSSSSALAEPACTQLLNHRNTYHHIQKTEDSAANEETSGKVQQLQLTFRNPPDNYFFMSWNWPVIRKISLYLFLSGLAAMVAVVVAMIWSLPKKCNPEMEWYQGSVFYEIFPASFADSNKDGIGDIVGLIQKLDYIAALGVGAVRLNPIFKTQHYPEDYKNVTTLLEIAPVLGDFPKFDKMAEKLRSRNISLVLDLPVWPLMPHLTHPKAQEFNSTVTKSDLVEEALIFWISHGVDGFYLKNLEHLVDDPNFPHSIRKWKRILGPSRPLIVSKACMDKIPSNSINILLNNVDLIDIHLDIEKGVNKVTKQLDSITNSSLFRTAGMPWVHWSLGDDSTTRLANLLSMSNATVGATLLQLMLPGTPSIFYGNEVGLQQVSDPEGEREDLQHLYQLSMLFKSGVLFWMHGELPPPNFDHNGLVSKMIKLRSENPSIYVNSVYKEGDNKANAEVKYSRNDLLVVQRWYPRRKSFVVVSNLGSSKINEDLSTSLYSGLVVIGPKVDSKPGSVSFKDISLWPGESVIIMLD